MELDSIRRIDADRFIGHQIGTATILKELTRGGMAVIFIAYQQTLKRQIAVKVLPRSHLTPRTAELFQTEAEAAANLSHPNIIQIYEVGETDEFLFFTMQLVRGSSLWAILKKTSRRIISSKRILPVKITIEIIIQVLDALDYAHQNQIIHMDIKPQNVLVENHSQRPLISDFGLARLFSGEKGYNPASGGTPLYMAPEQIIDREVDRRADIYAAGTMLFQMLVPALPIRTYGSHESLLKDKLLNKKGIYLERASTINPAINSEMDKIIDRATAYEPEQRYANCREFINDLKWYRRRFLYL
jgi:serine/threonine-protein kinase